MDKVTIEQCKAAVMAHSFEKVDHHRCCGCGYMTAYVFPKARDAYADPVAAGYEPDDIAVGFDPGCDCSSYGPAPIRESSWSDFVENFNMQTPEIRERMWKSFLAGGATHEAD